MSSNINVRSGGNLVQVFGHYDRPSQATIDIGDGSLAKGLILHASVFARTEGVTVHCDPGTVVKGRVDIRGPERGGGASHGELNINLNGEFDDLEIVECSQESRNRALTIKGAIRGAIKITLECAEHDPNGIQINVEPAHPDAKCIGPGNLSQDSVQLTNVSPHGVTVEWNERENRYEIRVRARGPAPRPRPAGVH